MKRLLNALTDPENFIVILPVITFTIIAQILDLADVIQPRYDFLCFIVTLSYVVSVIIILRNPKPEEF